MWEKIVQSTTDVCLSVTAFGITTEGGYMHISNSVEWHMVYIKGVDVNVVLIPTAQRKQYKQLFTAFV